MSIRRTSREIITENLKRAAQACAAAKNLDVTEANILATIVEQIDDAISKAVGLKKSTELKSCREFGMHPIALTSLARRHSIYPVLTIRNTPYFAPNAFARTPHWKAGKNSHGGTGKKGHRTRFKKTAKAKPPIGAWKSKTKGDSSPKLDASS